MIHSFRMKLFVASVLLVCCTGARLEAAGVVSVPFVPTGLKPGDTYQIAFVTSGLTDAISPSIGFYNEFVQSQAELPGSITEHWHIAWSAIAGTRDDPLAVVNARVTAPVFLLDGTKLADGVLDFWDGDLAAPLVLNQDGRIPREGFVWTGFLPNGLSAAPANLGTSGFLALGGSNRHSDVQWLAVDYAPTTFRNPMYVLSEEITVVPEPTTLGTVLMLIGLSGVGGYYRRQRERTTVPSPLNIGFKRPRIRVKVDPRI